AWDYDVPQGSIVVAARPGVVIRIWNHSIIGGSDKDRFLEYGNFILIDHLDGTFAQYYHLAKDSFTVQSGEYVLQGEPIAASGDTGYVLGPHLHYAVFDKATNNCIPIRFFDFKKNNGVPCTGDRVLAASPSKIPIELIRKSKQALHASLRAEGMALIDLAWQYAIEMQRHERYAGYYYIRVLQARASRLHEELLQRIERLTRLDLPTLEDRAEASRYISTLDPVRDWKIKWVLYNLKKKIATWQESDTARWQEQDAAMDTWIQSIRLECAGEMQAAAFSYIETLTTCQGPIRERALSRLQNMIIKAHADLKFDLSLCAEGIKIATPQQLPRVRDYAQSLWSRYRPLLLAWAVYFPEDRKRARQALELARKQIEQITSQK
ncbi:MAG: M23 family metallopeptidase, partial [Planctomycetota bacterium]